MRRGYWSSVWREFKKNRLALAGLIIVIAFISIAICAPLLANSKPYVYYAEGKMYFPLFYDYQELRDKDLRSEEYKGFKIFPPVRYSYSEYDLDSIVVKPSAKHLLGTDEQGRDLLTRMIHGSRVSIFIGFIAVAIYVAIGIIIGSIAGYYGGWIDIIISRFIEIIMCFPTFFLILTILALWGPNLLASWWSSA
jgi:peptide/nickel transport system permease protein